MTAGEPQPDAQRRTSVVGIGASAGGLEALQELFAALPEDLGLAFVVVVHLSPQHESAMAEILGRSTGMPVEQVEESTSLEPDRVYVVPPDRRLRVWDDSLAAVPFASDRERQAPIDFFFRSLAEHHGDGFAMVLSGSGSDGSLGLKAIKEKGGLILVQDPREAKFDSMPCAAIATGLADVVLPVRGLAARLVELDGAKRRLRQEIERLETGVAVEERPSLSRILAYLRARTGHDFSDYKQSTLARGVGGRMQLHRKLSLDAYLDVLRDDVEEVQALFNDLLISVTHFFRDPEAWGALAETVVPRLFAGEDEDGDGDGRIRVWVPGCATGEEAYSLAILLLEEAERRNRWPELMVFASDLDGAALATAREGRYPAAIAADVAPERLRRYFERSGEHYAVSPQLRDCVLFAHHSLLRDPPFANLDLLSCRNLLIYLNRDLQERVFGVFRYALRPGGFLFLGSAEHAEGEHFDSVDKGARIYRARDGQAAPHLPDLLLSTPGTVSLRREPRRPLPPPESVHRQALEDLAPPSLLVDDKGIVVHLSESAGRFLQHPGGAPSSDVVTLVREELRSELRSALYRALAEGRTALTQFVAVRFDGAARRVAMLVRPRHLEGEVAAALVVFLEGGEVVQAERNGPPTHEGMHQVEEELSAVRQRFDSSEREHQASNEELQASNEELQSLNEEYRSTAEELETSREELQSLNEELQTVNQQLKDRYDEVSRSKSDLENLMAATEIGTLFLDRGLRIQRLTPTIGRLFNVSANDRGREIGDFTHHLRFEGLEADARRVLDTLVPVEREVESDAGDWFLLRVRPYRTLEDHIDGVVATFVDVTERKRNEETIRRTKEQLARELEETRRLQVMMVQAVAATTLEQALDEILAAAIDLQGADMGVVYLIDPADDRLEVVVQRGFEQGFFDEFRDVGHAEASAGGRALASGRRACVEDVVEEERYAPYRELARRAGYRAVQSTPLSIRGGERVGVLTTHFRQPRTFGERDGALLDQLARQADLLIGRLRAEAALQELAATLEARVVDREETLRGLSAHLMRAEQDERRRIARMLHDDLQQLLYGVQLRMVTIRKRAEQAERSEIAEAAAEAYGWLADGIEVTRRLSVDLVPPGLAEEGLAATFAWLARQMEDMQGLRVELRAAEDVEVADEALRTLVFQTVRELLFNVVKHAGTDRAAVEMERRGGRLVVTVIDEGAGFEAEALAPSAAGFGLFSARERISIFGGELEVHSVPGDGTRVTMSLPLPDPAEDGEAAPEGARRATLEP